MDFLIDFDEASREWRKNKIYNGKGHFQYKCCKPECSKPIYLHTTQHKLFSQFAIEFDLINQHNPKQYTCCEDHLNE
jgi:hypothetical protein